MRECVNKLVEVLGLQEKRVRKIDFHFEVGYIPTAEVEILLMDEQEGLVSMFKNYRLEEIVDD